MKTTVKNKAGAISSRFNFFLNRQSGFGLVESLVAVAIVGSAVLILLGGLSTGARAVGIISERTVAENLGRSQLEYVRSLTYRNAPYSYGIMPDVPDDFSLTADASSIPGRDIYIQKITVNVYREGRRLYTIEDFRVRK